MTKKHVEALAYIIKSNKPTDPGSYASDSQLDRYEHRLDAWYDIKRDIVNYLKENFPKFDVKNWNEYIDKP